MGSLVQIDQVSPMVLILLIKSFQTCWI